MGVGSMENIKYIVVYMIHGVNKFSNLLAYME